MVRTRIFNVERPETTPSLVFERFNAEGNSADAVVYVPEDGILLYKDLSYTVRNTIPDSTVINDSFQDSQQPRMILKYTKSGVGNEEKQMNCYEHVIPNIEQRAKLTQLFQQHGAKVAQVAEKMKASVAEVKALLSTLKTDAESVCPGYEFGVLCAFGEYVHSDPIDQSCVEDMDENVENLLSGASDFATAEPFSKKRKMGAQ